MARYDREYVLNEFDEAGNWVSGPFHPDNPTGTARTEETAPSEEPSTEPETLLEFDPADFNIEDVVAYVESNPDEREAVVAAEKAGKNRTTLLAQLQE